MRMYHDGELGKFYYDSSEFNIITLTLKRRKDSFKVLRYCGADQRPIIPKGVKNCHYMFAGCTYLKVMPVIPYGVENCSHMFDGCTGLEMVDTPFPNTVIRASCMFLNCTSLKTVSYVPNNVHSCFRMFDGCTSLKSVWGLPKHALDMSYMFKGCKDLEYVCKLPKGVRRLHHTFDQCDRLVCVPNVWEIQDPYCIRAETNGVFNPFAVAMVVELKNGKVVRVCAD